MSISAVNAEYIDQTNDTLEIDDSDILSAAKTGTFSDLADDITASISENRLNIEKDYKVLNNSIENIHFELSYQNLKIMKNYMYLTSISL